jgi:hypothetical protein
MQRWFAQDDSNYYIEDVNIDTVKMDYVVEKLKPMTMTWFFNGCANAFQIALKQLKKFEIRKKLQWKHDAIYLNDHKFIKIWSR